jgi:hypothetical protein
MSHFFPSPNITTQVLRGNTFASSRGYLTDENHLLLLHLYRQGNPVEDAVKEATVHQRYWLTKSKAAVFIGRPGGSGSGASGGDGSDGGNSGSGGSGSGGGIDRSCGRNVLDYSDGEEKSELEPEHAQQPWGEVT